MFIELSQLPQTIQQQILTINDNEIVQIVDNGKIIKNIQLTQPKSYAKGDFDYDLERMKNMMDCEFHQMPDFIDDDAFFAWVNA